MSQSFQSPSRPLYHKEGQKSTQEPVAAANLRMIPTSRPNPATANSPFLCTVVNNLTPHIRLKTHKTHSSHVGLDGKIREKFAIVSDKLELIRRFKGSNWSYKVSVLHLDFLKKGTISLTIHLRTYRISD
ncbi:hypothetical protein JHK82_043286 [Glycine max]|nr:hypothetical protein JHK82_043286 [Glycine max]